MTQFKLVLSKINKANRGERERERERENRKARNKAIKRELENIYKEAEAL
jgi:hypothetical protein